MCNIVVCKNLKSVVKCVYFIKVKIDVYKFKLCRLCTHFCPMYPSTALDKFVDLDKGGNIDFVLYTVCGSLGQLLHGVLFDLLKLST